MDIKITLDFYGPPFGDWEGGTLIEKAEEILYRRHPDVPEKERWRFSPTDTKLIQEAKDALRSVLPPESGGVTERVVPSNIDPAVIDKVDWFLVVRFADDASNGEITHHTDSIITCPICGNQYQDPRFVPALRAARLPARPKLMTFYGFHKLFCRPKFIDLYKNSGLTGLTFVDWGETDKHKVPLSLIYVKQHKWQDRTGVCDKCEMKTNATSRCGLFNVHEKFQYDIQYLSTFDEGGEIFVLSRAAMKFFEKYSGYMKCVLEEPVAITPIIPGYLEDLVWPEPRLFANGEKPVSMLRSSWEKK